MHLLFVEDDADDQHIIRTVMQEIDATVTLSFANNGLDALAFLDRQDSLPDFLFLDINMPLMTGLETLAELKKVNRLRGIPVFMLSTAGDKVSVSLAQRLGANGYLVKPLKFKVLKQILMEVLRLDVKQNGKAQAFLHWPGEPIIPEKY